MTGGIAPIGGTQADMAFGEDPIIPTAPKPTAVRDVTRDEITQQRQQLRDDAND